MSFALSAGISGLKAHQKMFDLVGNNLANVNTTAFKAKTINFAELLNQTITKGSQPTVTVGGTNPQQIGSGVDVAGTSPDTSQGNIVSTGNPLDLAIEGQGYFVISNGSQDLYTRDGSFSVDSNGYLVDPNTGYRVQRIGSVGESDGFQTPGDSSIKNIRIPYDVAIPAKGTSEINAAGNLSADGTLAVPATNVLTSSVLYTTNNGATAVPTTELAQLDQFSGTFGTATTITASGFDPSGNALADATGLTVTATTTLQDVIDHLNSNVFTSTEQVASLVGGRIRVTDVNGGYSLSDLALTWVDNGSANLTMPPYFEVSTVGGDAVRHITSTIYDSQGGQHVLSAAFTRTNTANQWDMVLTSVTGHVSNLTFDNRRIRGIEFAASDGSYSGVNATIGDTPQFVVTFSHDASNPQTIAVNMGTVSQLDGLTQFAGNSTAAARGQDGYEMGRLTAVSVDQDGTLMGSFSNGINKGIATMQLALFQNPAALENKGGNYYTSSPNSGAPIATQALAGGAGTIHGGALEKSNADVATEFVNMIQAQNGFQASARTLKVANDLLRELNSIIR